MKNIIIDTNILFSTLLAKNKKFSDIIFSPPNNITLYSSKFAIVELFKHKEKLQKFTELDENDLLDLLHNLLKHITLFDENTLTNESINKAIRLCKDIDEKDIIFLAIAIELDGFLWTGDKQLIKGLKTKGFNSFFKV
ncbi:putative toxin-antitoxin system toxin component, PIN family [bacterium]|nr:putative toxin-antitoxin system toxin component, PIN family [bacterium]